MTATWPRRATNRVDRVCATAGLLGCAVATLGLLAPPSRGAGPTAAPISMITAKFHPIEHATHYTVQVDAAAFCGPITVSWTLTLACVDKGCPEPPGVHGTTAHPLPAVDPGCDNDGVGTRAPVVGALVAGQVPQFVWHHPPASEDPTHTYHCDTARQGPKGHQGIVRVEVSDGHTTCTTTYKGTANSTPTSFRPDYTTDMPTCQAAGPLPLGLLAALQAMDRRLTSLIGTYAHGRLTSSAFRHDVGLLLGREDALIKAYLPPIFGLPFFNLYTGFANIDDDLGRARLATRPLARAQLAAAAAATQQLETQLQRATGVPAGLVAGLHTLSTGLATLTGSLATGRLTGNPFRLALSALVNQEHVLLGTFIPPVFGLTFFPMFRDLEDIGRDLQTAQVDEPLTRRRRPGGYTRSLVARQLTAAHTAMQNLQTPLYRALAAEPVPPA